MKRIKMDILRKSICVDCGKIIYHIGKRRLEYCQLCKEKHSKESRHRADKKWRETEKGKKTIRALYQKNKYRRLGTTQISQHFCGDMELEKKIIKEEIKKLRLDIKK